MMPTDFEIDAYRKSHDLFVVLRGRLILQYCHDAKTRLINLLTPQVDHVYLYLAELQFLDSAGLGVLVALKMSASKHRCRLTLLSLPSRIEDIFRVSKLDTIFEIHGGTEAEVIRGSLQNDANCLWRDKKDQRQRHFSTASEPTPQQHGPLTQVPFTKGLEGDESDQKVKQYCLDAVEYIKRGEYQQAIDAYRNALSLDKENLTALNNLGVIYEKRPEWYGEARNVWQEVLQISTRNDDEKHARRARKHLESLSHLIPHQ